MTTKPCRMKQELLSVYNLLDERGIFRQRVNIHITYIARTVNFKREMSETCLYKETTHEICVLITTYYVYIRYIRCFVELPTVSRTKNNP